MPNAEVGIPDMGSSKSPGEIQGRTTRSRTRNRTSRRRRNSGETQLHPEDIPVPTDDELFCQAFTLVQKQCWEISLNLTDQESKELEAKRNALRIW